MSNRRERWRLFDDHANYVDRFGLLLLIATLAVITLSLVDLGGEVDSLRSEIGQILVTLFVGGTILISLRASGVGRRLRVIADIVIGLGVALTILVVVAVAFSDTPIQFGTTAPWTWVVLSALAPALVVRRLLKHKQVSTKTLLGAVSAYLLIALAFNFAFITTDSVQDTPFFGQEEPTTSFMYFSLVTITTLGFGDLSPVEPFGRLLTTMLAVIGQVYLVTFVGMIVGLLVGQRDQTTDA